MAYWLVKSDPETYSWSHLIDDKSTSWDGVRNYQARNNLQAMKNGDKALFYHSVVGKAVVGITEITKEAYPDPTTKDERWVAVDLKAIQTLENPVSLELIKSDSLLAEIALIKQSRLSVMPLSKKEFDRIVLLGK